MKLLGEGARDTALGILGKCIELKAMGPDEIYHGRKRPRAKAWALQILESEQRRRSRIGDRQGWPEGRQKTRVWCSTIKGGWFFKGRILQNTAERWTSMKTVE